VDRAGDWICGVVYCGVWQRGVVYGLGTQARVWAVCGVSDHHWNLGAVLCLEAGGVGIDSLRRGLFTLAPRRFIDVEIENNEVPVRIQTSHTGNLKRYPIELARSVVSGRSG
jgi:hypothetical protein